MLYSLIRLYKLYISPALPANTCRFFPTCSEYAMEALKKHGTLKGSILSFKRVLKCHPYHPGGYDPIP